MHEKFGFANILGQSKALKQALILLAEFLAPIPMCFCLEKQEAEKEVFAQAIIMKVREKPIVRCSQL